MTGALFTGWRRLSFPPEYRAEVFDTAYRAGIRLWGERRRRNGPSLSVRVGLRDAERLSALLAARGIGASLSEPEGLPAVLCFLRRRPGIPLGLLLFVLWTAWSSGVVWDVRIEGNEHVPDEAILAQLEELGFGIGTRFREVDFDQLHADYRAAQDEIAWLSVYMDGTVARVQVWETMAGKPSADRAGMGANVIASADGVIEEVRVFEGQAAVKPGDVIRTGEVAISGAVEKKDGGVRWEYAEGEVLATVAVPLSAEAPFERTETRATGREKRSWSVKIFKKTVKLFEKGGIAYGSCDTIDTIGRVCLFGRIPLPLWCGTTVVRETEPVTVTVAPEEARAEARAEMRRLIREAAAEGQLAGKIVREETAGGSCRVDAVLYVTKDIGETSEFLLGDMSRDMPRD